MSDRIPIIGQNELHVEHFPNDLAYPSAMAVINAQGNQTLKIAGGMTKLEHATILIAGQMTGLGRGAAMLKEVDDEYRARGQALDSETLLRAVTANRLAMDCLNVCEQVEENRRQAKGQVNGSN